MAVLLWIAGVLTATYLIGVVWYCWRWIRFAPELLATPEGAWDLFASALRWPLEIATRLVGRK